MRHAVSTAIALGLGVLAPAAHAATATRGAFGALADGTKVEAVTLTNGAGMSARIMTLGATLQSLMVPDKAGHKDDVVLGYDTAQEYLAHPDFFGASVGRYANRIAKGKFASTARAIRWPPMTAPIRCMAAPRASTSGCGRSNSVASGPQASGGVQLCQRRWRGRLSRRTESHRHLYAERTERAEAGIPRHHLQAHGAEPHQPFLFQPVGQ